VIEAAVAALVMGIAGGAHCVAMCGGVATAACGTSCTKTLGARASHSIAFHAGRVVTYAAFGALAGALGAIPLAFVPFEVARLALRVVAAVLLLGLGLHLTGLDSFFVRIESIGAPVWSRVAPLARKLLPVRSAKHAVLLGAAWGFVPCGLVYAALSLALGAGSIAGGAFTMFAFGLGTLPVMVALTTIASDLARRLASGWGRRVAGAIILVLAAQEARVALAAIDITEAASLGTKHACCHGKK
jgi:hypothetical protein